MGACCGTRSKPEVPPEIRSTDNGSVRQTHVNVRDLAPQWSGQAVVNGLFKDISLDDYKGKYLVIFFYPLDFSFVCPTEIIAFSDRIKEFKDIGCELVACSTDSVYSHFAWTSQPAKQGGLGPVNFPLMSDNTHKIAKAYNVYKEDDGTTYRGLFVIDTSQKVRQITINDCQVGRSVDETLRLVQAFQYTDIHGEVCQAGWKPGDGGLKLNNQCAAPCTPTPSPPSTASLGKH